MQFTDSSNNTIILNNYERTWNKKNTITLLKWVMIGSYYINVLERSINQNRFLIRVNTIQSIILTTATGSIGVSQISSFFTKEIQISLTILFTFMSFFLTLTNAFLKVFLIHENLEKYIQIKQEWTSFITTIFTELQLPIEERTSALTLIRDNKNMYLSLLNKDIEISKLLAKDAKKHIKNPIEAAIKDYNKKQIYDKVIEETLNEYYLIISNTGVSISDISNYTVKTEICDMAKRNYIRKKPDIENDGKTDLGKDENSDSEENEFEPIEIAYMNNSCMSFEPIYNLFENHFFKTSSVENV